MDKKNMNANLQSITENPTARNTYLYDFDDYTPAIVKLARSSNKTTLDDFLFHKTVKEPFYSEANDKYKHSYDILDELVKSTERVDSRPLQHSAKEYREALEVLGDACS